KTISVFITIQTPIGSCSCPTEWTRCLGQEEPPRNFPSCHPEPDGSSLRQSLKRSKAAADTCNGCRDSTPTFSKCEGSAIVSMRWPQSSVRFSPSEIRTTQNSTTALSSH